MGVGPIPASKIKAYAAEELELDGEELDRFFSIIRSMDDEYLSLTTSDSKTKSSKEIEVPVSDVSGTRQLFRNLDARKKSVLRKKDDVKPS